MNIKYIIIIFILVIRKDTQLNKMKVLIVSHNPFSKTQNNGKTLEAIFNKYPKDCIFQLFFSDLFPDLAYCNNYFRITDKDVIINRISISKQKRYTTNFGFDEQKPILQNTTHISFKKKIQHFPLIRDLIWDFGKWKFDDLFRWVENNTPDYIFFVGGQYNFSHRIARYLSDKYQLPLVIYFTDDYYINPINRNWYDKLEKKRMCRFYNKTVRKASLCYVIGSKMANVYERHFNKEFYYIMNMVPLNKKLEMKPHDDIIISYFGGLHLNRWKQIVRLGNIVKEINVDSKLHIRLYVYSKSLSQEIEDSFIDSNVEYKGFVSNESILTEFSKSDILLHVESDDAYYKSLTKLSVSTKLPEYLSTGRCVLGFGPKDVASMELLSENHIGFVVSSASSDKEIKDKLVELAQNGDLRYHISDNAYQFALNNFDPAIIRQKFNNQITYMLKRWNHVDI